MQRTSEPRPAGQGLRQGRLHDTMPVDPAMPCADFVKPNPLDSDVIMDATARLLAPRRPVTPPAAPAPAPQKEQTKKEPPKKEPPKKEPVKKEQPKKGQPQKEETKAEPVKAVNQQKKKNRKKKKPQTLPQTPAKEQAAKPKAEPEKKPAAASGKKKSNQKKARPHGGDMAHRSDRQKDSTQQKSLMKPYYMNHED